MRGVREEVLGVVKEEDVDARQREARERGRELVLEEIGRDRVPQVGPVRDDLREGPALPLAAARRVEVPALQIADLRDDDDVLAPHGSARDGRREDLAHERLAVAVRVVRRRVDEVHARVERVGERAAVLGGAVVHAVAAEADARDARMDAAERPVGGVRKARGAHSAMLVLMRCPSPSATGRPTGSAARSAFRSFSRRQRSQRRGRRSGTVWTFSSATSTPRTTSSSPGRFTSRRRRTRCPATRSLRSTSRCTRRSSRS